MAINNYHIGMSHTLVRSFTEQDVLSFAQLSGDSNPIHSDAAYAATTQFKQRIVPGFLTASLFSAIIGTQMPGNGTIYLKQDLKFCHPAYLNQPLHAEVTIVDIDENKHRALLKTLLHNDEGTLLIDGTALVKLPQE